MNKSALTAIKRKTLSRPMQYLNKCGYLIGKHQLDFGCGKGDDAIELGMDHYDLNHTNGRVLDYAGDSYGLMEGMANTYSVITCNYVLNVIECPIERAKVLSDIRALLRPNGIAFISVRRDIVNEGHTSRGTYQKNIVLDLPVLHEVKNQYCIYAMDKENSQVFEVLS